MNLRTLILLLCILHSTISYGQQFMIEEFSSSRISKSEKVKGKRVLDFYSEQSGYTFYLPSSGQIDAQQGEGCMRLIVDKRLKFIKITDENGSSINWKIPVKKLKRRKIYSAQIAPSQMQEWNQKMQWLDIKVSPSDAIIIIDSTYHRIQGGALQLPLTIGKHAIEVISPLFESVRDSIELTAEQSYRRHIVLTPAYSYLSVTTLVDDAEIYLDSRLESLESLNRKRIGSGVHHIYARFGDMEYNHTFEALPSRRTIINIDSNEFTPINQIKKDQQDSLVNPQEVPIKSIPVTISGYDDKCVIYINNEKMGDGIWQGELPEGEYMITNKRDGLTSKPIFINLQRQHHIHLELNSPASNYGALNITANISGADIFLNGKYIGKTPCIVKELDTTLEYVITLHKDGYKSAVHRTKVKENTEVSVELKMKKY